MMPMMIAAKEAHPLLVKKLLESEAGPKLKNERGVRVNDLTPETPAGIECQEPPAQEIGQN